jgi:hypothetical protein
MIISTDVEKTFNKISTPLHGKTAMQIGIERI